MTAVSLLLQATVILALALAGARLARRSRASLRHLMIAAGFAGLLILPLASLVVPAVPIRVPVSFPPPADAVADAPAAWPDDVRDAADTPVSGSHGPRRSFPSISAVLFACWSAGAALALLPLASAFRQMWRLRRTALPWREGTATLRGLPHGPGPRSIDVVLQASVAGPMTCGVFRPAIVLPTDVRSWHPDDVQRALVHELEHVRRADWLTQVAARVVCGIYWFHPLVWIAWRRLVLEAERACDDAVVRRSDAMAYADQLVLLAERMSAAGQPQPAMAGGGHDLVTRVGAVLDSRQVRGRAGTRWVALACGSAILLAATISPLRVVPAFAQDARTKETKQTKERFEVASIRPCRGDEAPPGPARGTAGGTNASFSPGRMSVPCVTLEQLIYLAYASYGATPEMRLANDGLGGPSDSTKVRGGPDWVRSQRDKYAVEAAAPGASERTVLLGSMLRTLLEERFKLEIHRGTEDVPMYALTVAKSGFKLKPMKDGDCEPLEPGTVQPDPNDTKVRCGMMSSRAAGPNAVWSFNGFPISSLAGRLSRTVGRHVIDRTGIEGQYIYRFEFHPDENTPGIIWGDRDADTSVPQGASIFTALEQQLGLKLESVKAPRGFLVIDHIERPTANGGAAVLRR